MLSVAYGCGLRASEVTRLRVCDIDSDQMIIRVVQSKGGKDRNVMLLISTEFSCASRTLMHETGYGPGDRLGDRFHFLVFDPGTEFDRTAQAYFGLSPRRDGFGRHARSP
jgi:hypothetical protein